MKMYTGRGDNGQTDLLGQRVSKNDPRVDLLGTLDEASSSIGLGRAYASDRDVQAALLESQRDLYLIMAELAFTDSTRPDAMVFPGDRLIWLESVTDRLSERTELPRAFVVPGETVAGAALDVARTVVRRGERFAVALTAGSVPVNPEIIRYLNRLSSMLFIAARTEDVRDNNVVRLAKASPTT
ncbi:MAG: cob(I)yrinic acid a,c-diamide adenosyltransferase [Thermomicrobiales bacterium]